MRLFGFADQYTMFDTTPVENLFIQEYMLRADGEFVKVYLYGLMQCYHPARDATIETIARDLEMPPSRVENAFAYWERIGLLRRVSDHPPSYVYINLKQTELLRAKDDDGLYKYADFNKSLQAQFGSDRMLHPQDFERVYDWIEGLGLPEEVVLMLVSGQIRARGKKFPLKAIDAEARKWAEAGVRTISDAEEMSRTSTERYAQVRQVYKKLGRRFTVSEPDEALFTVWTQEWGFDIATILEACDETTKGVPTFAYLNGILERMYAEGIRDGNALRADHRRDDDVKALLRNLGMAGTSPTEDSRSLLDGFLGEGFEREAIALAATRVARKGGKLDALQKTLAIWHSEGVFTLQAAKTYLEKIDGARPLRQGASPLSKVKKTVPAQQYTQREYTREELDALFEVI
ncbi:MAG: DnaD domain protein [Clostridia bacterium]|nr:DnaD domain protein [Clostridia bacterium]